MSADLNSYQPKGHLPISPATDKPLSNEPAFPKSLYLIQPLFGSYELNPVASCAQASVPVPEGLDLDAWIVSPPQEASQVGQQGDDQTRKKTKTRKAKGKEVRTTNGRKEKATRVDNLELLAPIGSDNESPEDKVLREQVFDSLSPRLSIDLIVL